MISRIIGVPIRDHMSYSLNSFGGCDIGPYMGDYYRSYKGGYEELRL